MPYEDRSLRSIFARTQRVLADVSLYDAAQALAALEDEPLPLLWFPAAVRDTLLARSPGLRGKWTEAQAELMRLHIEHPKRLGSAKALRELIANRERQLQPIGERRFDPRPVLFAVYPKADHNGAFDDAQGIGALSHEYRVLYYEAASEGDLYAAIAELFGDTPAEIVALAGHGQQQALHFSVGGGETDALQVSDTELWQSGFPQVVASGGDIYLVSCSTGQGGEGAANLANFVADTVPQAFVHAPTVPTNGAFSLSLVSGTAAFSYVHWWREYLVLPTHY
jgi:hypothetical protein